MKYVIVFIVWTISIIAINGLVVKKYPRSHLNGSPTDGELNRLLETERLNSILRNSPGW